MEDTTQTASLKPTAEVIFVLGAGSMGPVNKALDEFRKGTASNISFTSTGGAFGGNLVFGTDETRMYAEFLLQHGVPESSLHYPQESERTMNTLVEARGSLPFLRSRIGKIERMILCSRPVHQRRAWLTFRKQHPGVQYLNRPCEEMLTVEHLPRLVKEVDRIKQYGSKGDLEEQEIPQHVIETCERLRTHLDMPH